MYHNMKYLYSIVKAVLTNAAFFSFPATGISPQNPFFFFFFSPSLNTGWWGDEWKRGRRATNVAEWAAADRRKDRVPHRGALWQNLIYCKERFHLRGMYCKCLHMTFLNSNSFSFRRGTSCWFFFFCSRNLSGTRAQRSFCLDLIWLAVYIDLMYELLYFALYLLTFQ